MDYRDVYIKYKKSCGVEKASLAKALAFHLSKSLYFYEEDIIDEVFDCLDIDQLWELARDCPNDEIRKRAKLEVDKVLDEIDRTFKDNRVRKEKCKIIKFEKRGRL